MKPPTANTKLPGRLVWTDATPFEAIPAGRSLVIEDDRPYVLHFGLDGWRGVSDRPSLPFGGLHRVSLLRADLRGETLNFTRFYPSEARWEGVDHTVRIDPRHRKPHD